MIKTRLFFIIYSLFHENTFTYVSVDLFNDIKSVFYLAELL